MRGLSVASWRGEGDIYRLFGTGTLNRTTSGAGSRGEASPNQPQTGLCRCFGRTLTRHPRREASRWHPGMARQSSIGSSARRPLPQAPQWHPRVAKGASIDPLARGPSTELLLGQGRVARLSGTGVKPVSCRCFGWISARHPRREASRWHPGMARQSSIGSSSIKCRCFMDVEVRIGCLSMKCRCFMDVEVRIGCSARCRACGNSRLCRNVAELASLPFLPNEGACPNHPFSSRTLHP